MTVLKIKDKEYKIKFGYNCFCDTDLMERVSYMALLMKNNAVENDNDISGLGKIKDLFCVVRELIFVGLEKYNPVKNLKEVGNLLDDYLEEGADEKRGLMQLFEILGNELMNEGFLADLLTVEEETSQEIVAL